MADAAIVTIGNVRRRHEIEASYERCLKAWREQYEVGIRLLKAEYDMRCYLAKSARDIKLRDLEGAVPEWPMWPGSA